MNDEARAKALLAFQAQALAAQTQDSGLEDVARAIGTGQKLVASLLVLCAPARLIERACGQNRPLTMDDLATIIFCSGSTGEPKGVMLSHFSVDANAQGAGQVLHLYQDERVLGILPFFHSFGYLVFWFVMFNNAGMVFHPSPLDFAAIEREVTIAAPFDPLYQVRPGRGLTPAVEAMVTKQPPPSLRK